MKSLFGLSMDTIMAWMLTIFLIVTAIVAVLALRNRLFFKMGLRNIPRRRAQTILIIFGLMLSTLIITSAFGTGDTVSYSVRATALTGLGNVDETVSRTSGNGFTSAAGSVTFLPPAIVTKLRSAVSGDSNVDGFTTGVLQTAPLQDLTSGQTKAGGDLIAVPAAYPSAFGTLTANDGTSVTLGQLGPDQVYLNQTAADKLSAHAGDSLRLFIGDRPFAATVRRILRNENLAGGGLLNGNFTYDPVVLMPLARAQGLLGLPGAVTTFLVSNRGDAEAGASLSDTVTQKLRALLAKPAQVARAKTILASSAGAAALKKLIADPAHSGVKTKLQDLQKEVARPGQSDRLKSLLSDSDVSNALESIKKNPAVAIPLNDTLAGISDYTVRPIKKDGLDTADLFGSIFTTIFVVFGLFSISAGVMLIFLIFVMLAAERRSEMGMARAVGTKRRHLIQQFLFEGYTYDLGAALVGMLLGILVGIGMVKIMASLFGAADFTLQSHVEPRSLVVAFCLGALVTFFTVAFSSWRVSRLNVVAAIRDLPEGFGVKTDLRDAFKQGWQEFVNLPKRPVRLGFIIVAAFALVTGTAAHIGLGSFIGAAYLAVRILFWCFRSVYRALISRGPILLLGGGILLALAGATKSEALLTIGISVVLVGIAMLLRWIMAGLRVPDDVRNRIGFSLAGILLVIFWLLPFGSLKGLGVPDYGGGIEMFFVSGIMLVLGGVWTVMYNSDLLLGGLMSLFGGNGRLAPILKMAITYPMQHKVRTGLTLAMFSLVIFTLMVMSVLVGSTAGSLNMARDTGNYQIFGSANPNNPIQNDGRQVIAANPTLSKAVVASAGLAQIGVGVRQPGQDTLNWQPYDALIADDAYLSSSQFTLHNRARGYSSDAQVWQTLRTTPGFAVIDGSLVSTGNGGGGGGFNSFTVSGFQYKDTTFKPQRIEVRDNSGGKILTLTVIGVLDRNAVNNLPQLTQGIYTGENTLTAAGLPALAPNLYVFRVAPGQDVHATALALGRAFLGNGLDVKESKKEFDTNQSINIGLNDLLQAFMGLGLVVGIAALGVIAFRSVVERRQEIGMLRAIGFQRSMIRSSFLLESSFIAILGTLLGVLLGLVLAKNLVDNIAKSDNSVVLVVHWPQILLIVLIAYLASLLTTYFPAWQASRVYPAEALRYE